MIDPFINDSWGLYAIDYDEDYEPYIYLVSAIVGREILFLVSEEAAKSFDGWDVDWSKTSRTYSREMKKRVEAALRGNS